MAPAKASSCCLWEMLFSLWNWLKGLFSSSSFAAEIDPNILALRQTEIQEKIQWILENHFSDHFLEQGECKAGIIIKLGGRIFVQYQQVTQEGVTLFRDAINNQMNEFVKYELEILPLDAKLSVETYFMKRVNERNRIVILSAGANTKVQKSEFPHILNISGGRLESPLGSEVVERMKDCPADFKQFFLAP
jgi:hypothetical protein